MPQSLLCIVSVKCQNITAAYSNTSFSLSLCVEDMDSWTGRLFGRLPHPCLLIHCWWNKRTYGCSLPALHHLETQADWFAFTAQLRGKKSSLYLDGFYLSCVFHRNWHAGLQNELRLNEVDAQKVSDFFFWLEIKAVWGVLFCALYPA